MSNRTAKYEERVQLHTALRPAVYCKLVLALAKMQATPGERRSSEQGASSMAAKTFQMRTEGSWSLKQFMLKHCYGNHSLDGTICLRLCMC